MIGESFELCRVDLVGPSVQSVSVGLRNENFRGLTSATIGFEGAAEVKHVTVQCVRCTGRRVVTPNHFDQLVGRDDLVRVQEQRDQHRLLARPSDGDRLAAAGDVKVSKDAVLHDQRLDPASLEDPWKATPVAPSRPQGLCPKLLSEA